MVAASAYLFTHNCISIGHTWKDFDKKTNLIKMYDAMRKVAKDILTLEDLEDLFSYKDQYDDILLFEDKVDTLTLTPNPMTIKSRMKITVLDPPFSIEVDPVKYCCYKWWGLNRPVGNRMYIDYQWGNLKARYNFIKDTWEETLKQFPEGSTAIEVSDLLHKLAELRGRHVYLSTSVGSNQSYNVKSLISRNYCYGQQLITGIIRTLDSTANYAMQCLSLVGADSDLIHDAVNELTSRYNWRSDFRVPPDDSRFPLMMIFRANKLYYKTFKRSQDNFRETA
jgi:hypothetical protein